MNPTDLRAQAILSWLTKDLGLSVLDLTPASSDASFRRYLRASLPQASWIIMDAPPERENIQPFIKMAEFLTTGQISAPAIIHVNAEQGFIALEDFGQETYFNRFVSRQKQFQQWESSTKTFAACDSINQLSPLPDFTQERDTYFDAAFETLFKLQQLDTQSINLAAYDEALLSRELGIFYEWFLAQYLKISIPEKLQTSLNHCLIQSALEQPKVLVHRDYHSRNLMVLSSGNPGVLDFQDAVIGPITYDLVSLTKDCYIGWGEQVNHWRDAYFNRLVRANAINCNANTFKRWFDLMGLQRHLKAIGIFVRLHLRDGKSSYLQDIPHTMGYIGSVCQQYPELAEFAEFWFEQLIPRLGSKS